MSPLLIQLLLASGMALVSVAIHLTGLTLLTRSLQAGQRLPARLRAPITLLSAAAMGLFAIHTVEIWLYAGLYLALQATADFEQALYFSTVTYASIGYGDVVMVKPYRILGAIEGTTGVIMLGWSTAFLVSLLSESRLLSHDWLNDRQDDALPPVKRGPTPPRDE